MSLNQWVVMPDFKNIMDSAGQCAKHEREDVDILSEWMGCGVLVQVGVEGFNGSIGARAASLFGDPSVAGYLSHFHDESVAVPADRTPDNIVFACESHYIDCMMEKLDIAGSLSGPVCARWHLRGRGSCVRFLFL